MRLVLRIGGSVLASPLNPRLLSAYAKLLKKLKGQGHEVVAVVGGGSLARELIKVAKKAGLSEPEQDEAAIWISRFIAQLLAMKLGRMGAGRVPTSVDEAAVLFNRGKLVVMGGVKPGMTTDAVAAMLADRINANLLVKATDQDGIYSRDPKKHIAAKKIDALSFGDLFKFFEKEKHEVGIHQILDPEAVRILQKRQTRTVVVNGFKPENVVLAMRGERVGTTIA